MLTLSMLPAETLVNVVEYVSKGWLPLTDLRSLSLVSKQMRELAFGSLNASYLCTSESDIHQLCERVKLEAAASYEGLRIAEALKEIKCMSSMLQEEEDYLIMASETARDLAAILIHLHRLESFSCIAWTPEDPSDIFPTMAKVCRNLRKLEVSLLPTAFPRDPNIYHGIGSIQNLPYSTAYSDAIFCFSDLTDVQVVTYVAIEADVERRSDWVPSALPRMLDRCPQLQSLSVQFDIASEDSNIHWHIRDLLWKSDSESLRNWPESLRELKIDYANCDNHPELLRDFLVLHPKIEGLHISEGLLPNLTFPPGSLSRLKKLTGPTSVFNTVMSQVPGIQLQSLYITPSLDPFEPELALDLLDQGGSTITEFRVEYEDTLFVATFKRLASAMPNLESLQLRGHFGGTKAQLAKGLKSFPNLRCLNMAVVLSLEDDQTTTFKKFQAFVESLAKACPRLEYLAQDPEEPDAPTAIIIRHTPSAESKSNKANFTVKIMAPSQDVSKRWPALDYDFLDALEHFAELHG